MIFTLRINIENDLTKVDELICFSRKFNLKFYL